MVILLTSSIAMTSKNKNLSHLSLSLSCVCVCINIYTHTLGLCNMDKKNLSRFLDFLFHFDFNHDFDTNRPALQL